VGALETSPSPTTYAFGGLIPRSGITPSVAMTRDCLVEAMRERLGLSDLTNHDRRLVTRFWLADLQRVQGALEHPPSGHYAVPFGDEALHSKVNVPESGSDHQNGLRETAGRFSPRVEIKSGPINSSAGSMFPVLIQSRLSRSIDCIFSCRTPFMLFLLIGIRVNPFEDTSLRFPANSSKPAYNLKLT
jgi:hypothetical protein